MSNNLEANENDGLLAVALSRAYGEKDKVDVWDEDSLRAFRKCYPHADVIPITAAESLVLKLRAVEARVQELEREKKVRSAIDPVTRLHNLCDGLAESRRESPYDEESWRLADEDNAKLRTSLKTAEARVAELERTIAAHEQTIIDYVARLAHA